MTCMKEHYLLGPASVPSSAHTRGQIAGTRSRDMPLRVARTGRILQELQGHSTQAGARAVDIGSFLCCSYRGPVSRGSIAYDATFKIEVVLSLLSDSQIF